MLILNRRLTQIVTSVGDGFGEILPKGFEIEVYPNPFNLETNVNISLPVKSFIKVEIYNLLGQKIGNLAFGNYPAGKHKIKFSPGAIASGVYFVRADFTPADNFKKLTLVKKILLIK